MSKEFIPYEEALALKELGFDEPCLAFYETNSVGSVRRLNTKDLEEDFEYADYECYAPLYQQAFRFFREEYRLVCGVREVSKGKYSFEIKRWEDYSFSSILRWFDSWAVAELDGLRKLIEIVNQNKEDE